MQQDRTRRKKLLATNTPVSMEEIGVVSFTFLGGMEWKIYLLELVSVVNIRVYQFFQKLVFICLTSWRIWSIFSIPKLCQAAIPLFFRF